MRPFLTILLLLSFIEIYVQKFEFIFGDTVNRFDSKGRKQGKWIEFFGDNGRNETYYVNDKGEGEYRWYNKENNIVEKGLSEHGKSEDKAFEFTNPVLQ